MLPPDEVLEKAKLADGATGQASGFLAGWGSADFWGPSNILLLDLTGSG